MTRGLPNIQIDIVSVHDVVRVHLAALAEPSAAGKRFICSAGQVPLREIASILNTEFKPHGYQTTGALLPDWLIRTLSMFDKKVGLFFFFFRLKRRSAYSLYVYIHLYIQMIYEYQPIASF